jgi:ubiquinone/menaquinone biosynthesis C-methylase UbiE
LAQSLTAFIDPADPVLTADRERLHSVRAIRAQAAQAYFARMAKEWDALRAMHVSDEAVDSAVLAAAGSGPIGRMLDLGTGTGRILQHLAPLASRAVGVDGSHAMLAVARANLERAGLSRVELRQGDVHALPFGRNSFDLVILHQVLHFLDDPARAIREAAATLAPGGRLIVVDFAPHDLEMLRAEHAHRRLGFAAGQISDWFGEAGLNCDLSEVVSATEGGSGRLKIMLWRGRDQRIQGDLPLRRPELEIA